MQYNQPFGISDPNAGYINGNPSTGTQGSIPPAASIEYPQREIANLITDCTLSPTNSNLHQLGLAVQTQRVNYATDTGTADAMTISLSPPPTQYTTGMPIHVRKGGSPNATSAPTINVNGLGSRTLIHFDGTALAGAELAAGTLFCAMYDGTAFRLTTPSTSSGGSGVNDFYGVDTGSADAMVSTIAGHTAYFTGSRYWITKAAFANATATPSLNINGLGAKPIVRHDNTSVEAAEFPASCMILFEYDGSSFRVLSTSRPSSKTEAEAGTSLDTFISPLTLFQRRVPFFSATGSVSQGIPVGVDTKVNNLTNVTGTMLNSGSTFGSSQFTCGTKDAGVWMFMTTLSTNPTKVTTLDRFARRSSRIVRS